MQPTRWITPAALIALFVGPGFTRGADDEKLKFDDLPKAVRKAVKEKFPEAKIRGISKEKEDGETVFEVEMTVDGKAIDIVVDDEGEIEAVEKQIEVEDLPRAVLKAIKARFSDAKIVKVEEVSDEDDVVVYEVAFSSEEKKSFEVLMSPNGKVLDKEDDEEEEKGEAKKGKEKDDDKKGSKKEKEDDDDKKAKKPKG